MAVDTFWQFAHRHPLLVGLVMMYFLWLMGNVLSVVLAS